MTSLPKQDLGCHTYAMKICTTSVEFPLSYIGQSPTIPGILMESHVKVVLQRITTVGNLCLDAIQTRLLSIVEMGCCGKIFQDRPYFNVSPKI